MSSIITNFYTSAWNLLSPRGTPEPKKDNSEELWVMVEPPKKEGEVVLHDKFSGSIVDHNYIERVLTPEEKEKEKEVNDNLSGCFSTTFSDLNSP